MSIYLISLINTLYNIFCVVRIFFLKAVSRWCKIKTTFRLLHSLVKLKFIKRGLSITVVIINYILFKKLIIRSVS